jgi:DNA-binding NarL/FixJ family response regulator
VSGPQIGVFIISENRLLRESLVRILNKRSDIWAVEAQELNAETVKSIEESNARVLMFDSAAAILSDADENQGFFSRSTERRLVLIAMEEDEELFLETIRRGVTGFLLKDASAVDVVATVRAVDQGEVICPPCLCRILFQYVARRPSNFTVIRPPRTRSMLTRREQQLVPLIARGLTNKEIAACLNLSEQTVKNHIHHILHKVGAEDRLAVLDVCRTQGMEL